MKETGVSVLLQLKLKHTYYLVSNSVSIVSAPDLDSLFREHILIVGHHFESATEVSEPGAKVHLVFEFDEDIIVVEIGVSKEPV